MYYCGESVGFTSIVLFKKFFGGHWSFLCRHWYPYFGLLVKSLLSFKARVGSALFVLGGGVCVTRSLIFTSGVTSPDLLVTSMVAEPSLPHNCEQALVVLKAGAITPLLAMLTSPVYQLYCGSCTDEGELEFTTRAWVQGHHWNGDGQWLT